MVWSRVIPLKTQAGEGRLFLLPDDRAPHDRRQVMFSP
jgi:hypothetical protein